MEAAGELDSTSLSRLLYLEGAIYLFLRKSTPDLQ